MQEIEIELGVGDVVQIGDELVTILDIEHGEVFLRIDPVEEPLAAGAAAPPGK